MIIHEVRSRRFMCRSSWYGEARSYRRRVSKGRLAIAERRTMEIALVLVLAAAAGVFVYRFSMGDGTTAVDSGFLRREAEFDEAAASPSSTFVDAPLDEAEEVAVGAEQAAPIAQEGYFAHGTQAQAYVPLAPGHRSWQTRALGLLGIVVFVPLAALVLALSLYQFGHVVMQIFAHFAGTGN
jgi:hypothetical protein